MRKDDDAADDRRFETPTTGSIRIDGVEVVEVPPNRRGVGMVFQTYALFPNMTAAQNIGFGLRVSGKTHEIHERVRRPSPHDPHGRLRKPLPPPDVRGAAAAGGTCAGACHPAPVLLLDEPLSALDAGIRVRLREEVRSIQRQLGITTIYVTHDQEEALSLWARVVVMREGRIAQVGTPFEIL